MTADSKAVLGRLLDKAVEEYLAARFVCQNPLSVKNLSCFMEKYGRKFREINKMFNFLSGKYYFLRVKWGMLIDCFRSFEYNTTVCESCK